MEALPRKFMTAEGMSIELIGHRSNVGVWIDGELYRIVSGVYKARWVALDYSRRHAQKIRKSV